MPRRTRRKGRSVDAEIAASHHAAARGDVLTEPSDLTRKQASIKLTQRPPRAFLTSIYWIQEEVTITNTLSSGGGVSESNFNFFLGQMPGASKLAALFDQYCIYCVTLRVVLEPSLSTVVAQNVSYGRIHTAIDFDSSTAVGSEVAIQEYGSVQTSEFLPGKSYERFVKPVVSVLTGASNSTSATGGGMDRLWVNSAFPNVPHFGIRILTAGNTSATSPSFQIYLSYVIGVRNAI